MVISYMNGKILNPVSKNEKRLKKLNESYQCLFDCLSVNECKLADEKYRLTFKG